MAHQHHPLGLTLLGQHHLTRQPDRIPVTVHTRIGTHDLDHFLLVAVLEQLLDDRRSSHTRRLLDLVRTRTLRLRIIVHHRAIRQIAVVRQALTEVRLTLTDHLEFHPLRRFDIHEVHKLIVAEGAACQHNKRTHNRYF